MIERIMDGSSELGIIIRANYGKEGIEFFTDSESSQQLGYMKRPDGYLIVPHKHNLVPRKVHLTQEVLFIRSGKVRVDFYTNEKTYLESRILNQGDIILLADGGHGLKILETAEIIEVKQGPYCGETDKERFEPIDEKKVLIKTL
ncbi:MAG TPA: hypothetical protein VKB95_03650 [Chitinophagaceae bacterium]|nr:hypothetical protein [Chitinophagaceae bacterium]